MTNAMSEAEAAVWRVVKAATGLCPGEDWNNGTHAKLHGYKQKLKDAVATLPPEVRAFAEGFEIP